MNKQHIQEIIAMFEESSVAKLELEVETFKIKLEKHYETTSPNVISTPVQRQEVASKPLAMETPTPTASHIITAPLVGTFYAARATGEPDFVTIGSKIKEGDILCIVEAMKVMNEIRADKDGTIKEIRVQNEDMVQYKQPLFIME